jgi:hypothetical protein
VLLDCGACDRQEPLESEKEKNLSTLPKQQKVNHIENDE